MPSTVSRVVHLSGCLILQLLYEVGLVYPHFTDEKTEVCV